jgi:hypothetical protein
VSRGVPHYSAEWVEAYRRRISGGDAVSAPRQARQDAPVARPPDGRGLAPYNPAESAEVPLRAAEAKQTQTERRYNRDVLGGRGRFEAVSLRLPGGGRYTPDFMTVDDGVVTFHEVKGSYRLGSQGRAFTAFHEAAAYYPMWRFVWAHWTGEGWDRKIVENTPHPSGVE